MGFQNILVDLLDRGSLMYQYIVVIDRVTIIYKTFIQIANSEVLRKQVYLGSTRTKLIVLIIVGDKGIDTWRELCCCDVGGWDILIKIVITMCHRIFVKKLGIGIML